VRAKGRGLGKKGRGGYGIWGPVVALQKYEKAYLVGGKLVRGLKCWSVAQQRDPGTWDHVRVDATRRHR